MGEAGLGGSGAVVVYRLTYAWAWSRRSCSGVLGGTVTHVSSIALKNEPTDVTPAPPAFATTAASRRWNSR